MDELLTTDSGLAALVDAPEALDLAGETLNLTPLKMRELPAFQRAVAPILADLQGHDLTSDIGLAAVQGAVQGAILTHLDAAMDAVALMARRERDWIEDLDPDAFLVLAARTFAVNARFFSQRIMPALTRELGGLFTALTPAATGSPSPPPSPKPASRRGS